MTDLTVKEEGKPADLVAQAFDRMGQSFEELLPAHVTLQRFKQVVMTAITSAPDLMLVASTPGGRRSILTASLKCASDGLVPDGREAALVPFNCKISGKNEPDRWEKQAQYMPMCRGIVTKMQQSPNCRDIGVNLVYSKEQFHYSETGDGTEFRHTPILFGDKGELIGAYAFMRTADGGFYVATADVAELDKIAATSKANNSPWKGPFRSEMQKKSVLKRLAKVAPVSRDVMDMLQYDTDTFHEIEAEPQKPRMLDRLKRLKAAGAGTSRTETAEPDARPEDAEGAVIDGEMIADEPEAPALPVLEERITKAQAEAYAVAWAALYSPLDKAGRDALWARTEDDVDRVGRVSSKAQDICNAALNSPAG